MDRVNDFYVYFIECDGFVKIGFATDIITRLSNIRCANPHPVKLLRKILTETPELIEESIHEECDQYRVHGEWFKLPPKVLEELLKRPFTGEIIRARFHR